MVKESKQLSNSLPDWDSTGVCPVSFSSVSRCNHSFSNLGKTSAATCFSTRHMTYVAKCDVQRAKGALISLLLLLLLHGGSVFSSWISSSEPSHHIFLRLTHCSEQISGIYTGLFYSRRSSLRNVETSLWQFVFSPTDEEIKRTMSFYLKADFFFFSTWQSFRSHTLQRLQLVLVMCFHTELLDVLLVTVWHQSSNTSLPSVFVQAVQVSPQFWGSTNCCG